MTANLSSRPQIQACIHLKIISLTSPPHTQTLVPHVALIHSFFPLKGTPLNLERPVSHSRQSVEGRFSLCSREDSRLCIVSFLAKMLAPALRETGTADTPRVAHLLASFSQSSRLSTDPNAVALATSSQAT